MKIEIFSDFKSDSVKNTLYLGYLILNIFIGRCITNKYCIPIIHEMSKLLNWNSSITGLAIMNLGNCIPSIIANFFVIDKFKDITPLVTGCSGSFMFMITICLGFVILSTRKMRYVSIDVFYRYIIIMGACYVLLLSLFTFKEIGIFVPIGMLIWYFLFLLYSFKTSSSVTDNIESIQCDDLNQNFDDSTSPNFQRRRFYLFFMKPIKQILKFVDLMLGVVFDSAILYEREGAMKKQRILSSFISPIMNFLVFIIRFELVINFRTLGLWVLAMSTMGILLFLIIKKKTFKLFQLIYTFVASCLYISLVCKEIGDGVIYYAKIYNISPIMVTSVVMGALNSLPDMFSCILGAKNGLFKTAVCSCLSSSMNDVLLRIGSCLLVLKYKYGEITNYSWTEQPYITALVMIPLTIIVIIINYEIRNNKLESELAYSLVIIYFIYVMLTYIIENPFLI
ncbi:hypothetical protein EDEG_00676 [Edhazardia aedis USNM 41457]|uniref:Sodium/calcium exchanger membrane region domain-containing protein n=1 Tax=Edhazardia aedis (strain USNM 41457) TaxID=1003232 RepID=J9DBV8_EDHAE|nr:hypothetical protein EDEG_00676 [Edhazardia aedis USNM 41457]|eukprot:EJW05211.1 hypothetical protein EDEG_00676 [Edhazardia aedis USNM 41457]